MDVIAATLDATDVYWCDVDGVIWSCHRAGCGSSAPRRVGSGLSYVAALASSANALYVGQRFLDASSEVTGAIARLAK